MNTLELCSEQLVFASDNTLKTTSLKIAEAFEKRHDHVIRDIKKIINSIAELGNAPKFGEVEYEDAKGEKRPAYEMDKDGFMLVVMGYTGEKAMAVKIAYIHAFNLMQAKLFLQPAHSSSDLSGLAGLIRAEIARALPKADPLLPPDQAAAINHSLQRLSRLFHPLSAPFADVLSLTRALQGLDTTYGMPHPDYQTLLTPAEPDPSADGGQPVPPTPSPTGYSRVLLYVTHNGQVERSETLPDTMCLVSIKNADTVVNFINYLLPEELLPDLLKAASQRMFRLMALRG
ncbi:Rha family transcriptional regulator [Methylovulum psychrotolerans]|uniref:Rha family transcriptional regulator n=1 Tax=Methylovulum psychrotolerans TaxID=1704499 RepID=UPI001BFF0C49|nr:Rha family transcriptional regulator [Methylovulum psychrotolerans]MBT9097503.1 Rha family transcriptional regulator [Methylovulum psychrotolerans]